MVPSFDVLVRQLCAEREHVCAEYERALDDLRMQLAEKRVDPSMTPTVTADREIAMPGSPDSYLHSVVSKSCAGGRESPKNRFSVSTVNDDGECLSGYLMTPPRTRRAASSLNVGDAAQPKGDVAPQQGGRNRSFRRNRAHSLEPRAVATLEWMNDDEAATVLRTPRTSQQKKRGEFMQRTSRTSISSRTSRGLKPSLSVSSFSAIQDSVASGYGEPYAATMHEAWLLLTDEVMSPADDGPIVPSRSGGAFSPIRAWTGIYSSNEDDGDTCFGMMCGQLKHHLNRLVVSPSCKGRLLWDVTGMFLLFMDLVYIPLQVFEESESAAQGYLRMVTLVFWSLDLIASFFVGYYQMGCVEMRLNRIAAHYAKSWFTLDLALVIIDAVMVFQSHGEARVARESGGAAKAYTRIIRAMRLLRMLKFRVIWSDLAGRVHSEVWRTGLYIFQLITMIVFVNHFVACGFYGLHEFGAAHGELTWVSSNFGLGDSVSYRYWTSMHWSLTQFTPASCEVVPVNAAERIFTVCVLLFALVVFSSFVSSITASMTHLRNTNAKKLLDELTLRRYITQYKISTDLADRVTHFVHQARKQRSKNLIRESQVALIDILPEGLKRELRGQAFLPTISVHPLFHILSTIHGEVSRRVAQRAASEKYVTTGGHVFGAGEERSSMIFVVAGSLCYNYTVNKTNMTEVIEEGHWANESVLWLAECPPVSPFVAEVDSDLVLINGAEFRRLAASCHHESLGLVRYADFFVKDIGDQIAACPEQGAIFNDMLYVKDRADKAFASYSHAMRHSFGHGNFMSRLSNHMLTGRISETMNGAVSTVSMESPGGSTPRNDK